MEAAKVDRTCRYCGKDRGGLVQIRFYDWAAMRGTTDHRYPIGSGGALNCRISCGMQACLEKAMEERKKELGA